MLTLTPAQALVAVEGLLRDRKVTSQQVQRYADRLPDEIRSIESRLALLQGGVTADSHRGGPRRARPANPQVEASRKLQGRYMGLMRHASARVKAQAQRICAEKNREAAVAFLEQQQH